MTSKPEITAANFPALHTFLRGYFHEDVADEYGTPPEAADQFCELHCPVSSMPHSAQEAGFRSVP